MNVLFVNHSQRSCGVQQFGESTFNTIKDSKKINFKYAICDSVDDLYNSLENVDSIIFNHYPSTLPWLGYSILYDLRRRGIKTLAIFHEAYIDGFNYYIHPDPYFEETENRFRVGRVTFNYDGIYPKNEVPIVGSFGFGFENKGWNRILHAVKDSLPDATVHFHMPYAYFGDKDGNSAEKVTDRCLGLAESFGINLIVDHKFLETAELLKFLASNDINCFFYDELYGRGIASTIDYALSVKRPIALTRSYMFRHMKTANIFIEDLSLREILDNGIKPLEPFYKKFTKENLIKDYERIFERIA